MRITVEYDGGLDEKLDEKLRVLATACRGADIGGGCFLQAPYTRDLEFEFEFDENAKLFEREAKAVVRKHLARRLQ